MVLIDNYNAVLFWYIVRVIFNNNFLKYLFTIVQSLLLLLHFYSHCPTTLRYYYDYYYYYYFYCYTKWGTYTLKCSKVQ